MTFIPAISSGARSALCVVVATAFAVMARSQSDDGPHDGADSVQSSDRLVQAQTRDTRSRADRSTSIARILQNPVELELGGRLYETHCVSCHGPRGEGAKGPTLAQPGLPRATDDESLVSIISRGIGGTEMPRARMERHEIDLVAAFVKHLGSLPRERVPGDPERGEQIYETRAECAKCHSIGGKGGVIGPDLTDIGLKRSAAYLRRSITEPNSEVPQSYSAWRSGASLPNNFLQVRLVPRGQEEITGVRVNEDTFSIQIRDLTGRVHSFYKSELAELHKDFGKSPMPSYAEALTPNQLDDLVAYLVSLRGPQ